MGDHIIYIDADSCPVKEDIVEITIDRGIVIQFVAFYAHMKNDVKNLKWKFVDSTKEAVVLYIMNHVKAGDLVITQEIRISLDFVA